LTRDIKRGFNPLKGKATQKNKKIKPSEED
jgi:hypothetical protein